MGQSEASMQRFAGQVAVVTGAGGGIGTAIAQRLASEGAHVVVCDVTLDSAQRTVDAITSAGHQAEAAAFDVADGAEVASFAEGALSRHGRIDVLVNNAGINRRGALLDLADDDWNATMRVNLDSMYHLSRAFLPSMVASGGARS